MTGPTLGAMRWARAAALGVATLALAIGAHVSAGGAMPSMTVLAFLALPLAMAAVIVTGRQCGPLLLLGSMTAAQLMLHHTLMAVTGQVGNLSGQMASASASAMGDHVSATGGPATALAMNQAMSPADSWSLSMTATHVIATVIAALLLARSEQALWQLVSKLIPSLPSLPSLVGWPPLQTPSLVSMPRLAFSEMSGGLGLRGPPLRLVAAD
jgi:hypothetical protein